MFYKFGNAAGIFMHRRCLHRAPSLVGRMTREEDSQDSGDQRDAPAERGVGHGGLPGGFFGQTTRQSRRQETYIVQTRNRSLKFYTSKTSL